MRLSSLEMTNQFQIRKPKSSFTQKVEQPQVLQDLTNNPTIKPQQQHVHSRRRQNIIPLKSTKQKSKQFYMPIQQSSAKIDLNFAEKIDLTEYWKEWQIEDGMERNKNYLKQHYITGDQYIKMIDWMMEVFAAYRKSSSYHALFQSIEIFNQFLLKSNNYSNDDILLIGACCIYVSSKVNDIYSIFINDIYLELCNEEVSIHEIIQMEQEVCQKLGFKLIHTCPFSYFDSIMRTWLRNLDSNEKRSIYNKGLFWLKICALQCFQHKYIDIAISCCLLKQKQHLLECLSHLKLNINVLDQLCQLIETSEYAWNNQSYVPRMFKVCSLRY